MVASGKGHNQYSIRKEIYEKRKKKFRIMGNIKAIWIAFSQKQNHKKRNKRFQRYQGHSKHKLFKNQKSNYNNDKKLFISHLCQYTENSF